MLPCRHEEGKACVFGWGIRREVLKWGLRKESSKTEVASPGRDRGPEVQRTRTWQNTPVSRVCLMSQARDAATALA